MRRPPIATSWMPLLRSQTTVLVHEYTTESGHVHIFSNDIGFIKADVDLNFPTGDTVSAEVEGRHCDANLFVGLR